MLEDGKTAISEDDNMEATDPELRNMLATISTDSAKLRKLVNYFMRIRVHTGNNTSENRDKAYSTEVDPVER